MWPGPIDEASYELYCDTWYANAGNDVRMEAPGAAPKVASTMVVAIDEDTGIWQVGDTEVIISDQTFVPAVY